MSISAPATGTYTYRLGRMRPRRATTVTLAYYPQGVEATYTNGLKSYVIFCAILPDTAERTIVHFRSARWRYTSVSTLAAKDLGGYYYKPQEVTKTVQEDLTSNSDHLHPRIVHQRVFSVAEQDWRDYTCYLDDELRMLVSPKTSPIFWLHQSLTADLGRKNFVRRCGHSQRMRLFHHFRRCTKTSATPQENYQGERDFGLLDRSRAFMRGTLAKCPIIW